MNNEFIKAGERIVPFPLGLEYSLSSDKVYDLCWDDWENKAFLKENGKLNLPNPLYSLEKDDQFINRVLNYFNTTNANTTGVLLAGTKGTGKSVLAKRIAKESNLPIIVVSDTFRTNRLVPFFKGFKTPVCIIFDEIDKNGRYWDTSEMLKFLDGIEITCKKLVLFTCNDVDSLNENLFDRCSRIRYYKEYDDNSNEVFVKEICKNEGIEEIEKLSEFIIDNFEILSFDNILSFIREVKQFPDMSYEDLLYDMNISTKSDLKKKNNGDFTISINNPF